MVPIDDAATQQRDTAPTSRRPRPRAAFTNSPPRARSFVFLSVGHPATWLAAAAAVIATAGCGPSPPAPTEADEEPFFTVVSLPDTQYYAAEHPEILESQAQWILQRLDIDRIALVVHEGDIVDDDDERQWVSAARSLHRLDGRVPYVLSAGNHDYRRTGLSITRETSLDRYFPPSTFAAADWFKGTFEPGRIENSYAVIDMPGGPWLILALEFGPRDGVLAWASEIARRHAALPALVVTHAYLSTDGTRYDHHGRPQQLWNPHDYFRDAAPGDVNDGEEIWSKLVGTNDNILFVLSGHDLGRGIARLESVRPSGTRVHQLLANYQMGPLGGGGFLRLMRFHPGERRVDVRTYSPYSNRFKVDADNEFPIAY